jgi:hypothetical protein
MSQIHTVIFNNHYWTKEGALKWLKHNHLKPIAPARYTTNFIRFRIRDPKKFKYFVTKKLHGEIELVIGFH